MITPEYLEQCPDRLVEIYEQAERDIIADMARKISKYDFFSSAAEWQTMKLQEMGVTYKEIQKRLAKASGKSKAEIVKLLKEAGVKELKDDGVKPTQSTVNTLNAGLSKTLGTFDNLTRTTATQGTRQISQALDRAYAQVSSGAFSQETAVKNAISDLAKNGIEAYDSGLRKDYIDVVVRRAVRTGVNQTVAKIALSNADELGTDLVEVSAHSGARPSHAEWQGKVYSISGNTEGYEKLSEATGYGSVTGLCGANCRHTFYPFFEGDEPTYSKEELKSFDKPKYTYNGEKMTEYEATQRQRYIERQIRRWKREKVGMEAAGLSPERANAKLKKWGEIQSEFLGQTGLKRQYGREEIPKSVGRQTLPAPFTTVKKIAPTEIGKLSLEEFKEWEENYYDLVNAKLKLTADELKALDDYGEGGYELLNAYGRFKEGSDEFSRTLKKYGNPDVQSVKEKFENVKTALNKFELDEDIIVHRAVRDVSYITDDVSIDGLKSLKGKKIREDGFMSTSFSYQSKFTGQNQNAVHMEIVVPKGSNGAYIDKYVSKNEKEFLLNAGTEYKVLDGGERTITVKKYDLKKREFIDVETTERFLKVEVLPPKEAQKNIKTNFTKTKTIKEAEDFAKQFVDDTQFAALGISYSGITVEAANELNNVLYKIYSEYDIEKLGGIYVAKGNTKIGKIIDGCVAAYSPVRNSLVLNNRQMKNLADITAAKANELRIIEKYKKNPNSVKLKMKEAEEALKASLPSGRVTVPDNFEDVINHEIGHIFEKMIKKNGEFESAIKNMPSYAKSISGYATTDPGEYIAESFSSYRKGENLIDPILETIFEKFRK